MAVVILGGIVTSTILNMVVIPALYLKFGEGAVQTRETSLTGHFTDEAKLPS